MLVFLMLANLAAQAGAEPAAAEMNAQDARFRRMDRDGNGFITANEAPRMSATRGDGAPPSGGAAWVVTYDRDGDGKVSAQEYASGPQAAIMRATLTVATGS